MKHISVLVPRGDTILSSVVGPFKVLNKVNDFMAQQGKPPLFEVQLIGLDKEAQLYEGAFTITPHQLFSDVKKTDLIIIPAVMGDLPNALEENSPYFQWIKEQYALGAEVASLCMGAFILGCTGLLNGKSATTHWMGADAFRSMFPEVTLLDDKVITDENGVYTSGGAYSFLNLMLYLVEKYAGREVALFCSKLFEVDIDRSSQSHFHIFQGQKDHEDETIRNAQMYIEGHFTEKLSIEELANQFALSRRNFIRRFKKATSNTPLEYIQRVKVEAAKKQLESSTENINEVMYQVGYADSKSFRQLFKKITGLSPLAYRNKYNRHLAVA